MKIKFFISDVDGTLLDRMPVHARTFTELVASFGIEPEVAKKYYYESPLGSLSGEFAEILSKHNVAFATSDLKRLSREFFQKVEKEDVELFPGVSETIATLKRRGLKLCATSGSRTAPLETLFAKKGLPFDIVLGSDGEFPKEDAHITFFARFFAVAREEFCRSALYVGDGRGDMETAKQNGIFAVGITNTISAELLQSAGADEIITSFPEILGLIF